MELEGCKRGFGYLISAGQHIKTFVSDRHRGIAKWFAECHKSVKHYFDVWHVERSNTKKLLKASKEKGCERIKLWIKAIRRHMYWCAISTKEGFGDMIVAKWKSLIRHISNRHIDHDDALYSNCSHGELGKKKWIKVGMPVQINFIRANWPEACKTVWQAGQILSHYLAIYTLVFYSIYNIARY
jgi:hypothetical protein